MAAIIPMSSGLRLAVEVPVTKSSLIFGQLKLFLNPIGLAHCAPSPRTALRRPIVEGAIDHGDHIVGSSLLLGRVQRNRRQLSVVDQILGVPLKSRPVLWITRMRPSICV